MQNPDALSLHSRAWRLYPSVHLWVTYGWVYVGVCVCVRIFFVHNDCAVSSQDHDRFFVNAATPIADGLRRDPNSICCCRHHDRPLVNISYNYLDISLLSALLFPYSLPHCGLCLCAQLATSERAFVRAAAQGELLQRKPLSSPSLVACVRSKSLTISSPCGLWPQLPLRPSSVSASPSPICVTYLVDVVWPRFIFDTMSSGYFFRVHAYSYILYVCRNQWRWTFLSFST